MALKAFDYYITVSQNFKDMLVERGFNRDRIFVVYNGIDFNKQVNNMAREAIIEKYELKDTKHYVSMIARLHPVKGHRVFLDACREVVNSVKDISFLLVGDGEQKDSLSEYEHNLGLDEYVASGVLLCNLNKIRNDNKIKVYWDYISQKDYNMQLPDQDALNIIFKGDIKMLDIYRWNCYPIWTDPEENYTFITSNAVIIHYLSQNRPWEEKHADYVEKVASTDCIANYFFKLYYEYLDETIDKFELCNI
jgi:glycosyltransferase involved in cell wall biosynthesis